MLASSWLVAAGRALQQLQHSAAAPAVLSAAQHLRHYAKAPAAAVTPRRTRAAAALARRAQPLQRAAAAGATTTAAAPLPPAAAAAAPLPPAAAAAAQSATASAAAPASAPPPLPPTPHQHQHHQQDDAAHKQAALLETMKRLNKKLGTGTLMRLGEQAAATRGQFECLPSGCATLDVALGGGWARGRIVEVFGPESSGKTTLALLAIAQVQARGGQAVFVDAEHAFNKPFARQLGVDVDELIICQPSCGEDALEVVDQLLRSHAVDFVAVDSVSALLPRAELEGAIGDLQVAGQARLMSHGLRKLAANASKTDTTILFINQLRHKVGLIFGNPETTSGGQALKFYASQRVDVRIKEKIKAAAGGGDETGVRVKAKVVKNKVAPPYKSAEFVVHFARGIDADDALLEAASSLGVVQQRGSFFYHGEQRLGQGREAACALLASEPCMRQQLAEGLQAAMRQAAATTAAECTVAGGS